MTERPDASDAAEQIRLLEFQVEFLRRELSLVTKRYDDLRWSAAWTLAKPLKRAEDALHALARRMRAGRPPTRKATTETTVSAVAGDNTEAAIAARIAAKMKRPPAGR